MAKPQLARCSWSSEVHLVYFYKDSCCDTGHYATLLGKVVLWDILQTFHSLSIPFKCLEGTWMEQRNASYWHQECQFSLYLDEPRWRPVARGVQPTYPPLHTLLIIRLCHCMLACLSYFILPLHYYISLQLTTGLIPHACKLSSPSNTFIHTLFPLFMCIQSAISVL